MTTHPLGAGPGRPVQAHAYDIQAILGSGFGLLPCCTYHLLRIDDAALACRWLRALLASGLVRSVGDLGGDHAEVATVAFSHEGLRALGIETTEDFPFPTPFRMGITHPDRARLIGDTGFAGRGWGDCVRGDAGPPVVHVMVAHYRRDDEAAPHGPFGDGRLRPAASGLTDVAVIRQCRELGPYEPFGFRDGIAQPVIEGLRPFDGSSGDDDTSNPSSQDDVVKPGEFVLGHLTEYDEPSYCPRVEGWATDATIDGQPSSFGLNGSYLAVRQIVQDVEGFRKFERLHATEPGEATLAERMMGRRKDGTPLAPCKDPAPLQDDFRYRLEDAEGFHCPVGAHIRRANPRDTLGWDTASGIALARRHRILRRGRPFGQVRGGRPAHPRDPAGGRPGILFMALNGDLERQFELIQKRWLENESFNQYRARDPIVGMAERSEFSVPATPIGRHYGGMAAFTTVIGAGYFFVPGLAALRFVASRA